MEGLLGSLDWLVIVAYFAAVFGVAFWGARGEKTRESSAGYFLAGRNVGWFVIGASLFASNIGSEHLIGLAGTGAASGLAVGQFEILASLILLLLGWVFVPFYLKSGVFTMPEFLERRYSAGSRWYLAVISIVGYVLTKISVTIAAGGIVFESLMGIDFWVGALVVVIATGIYTVFGGLRAVLYTDLVQMFVLIGGSLVVTFIGLGEVGGWAALKDSAGQGFFSLWKPMSDPDFPWTGILFGAPILGVWYWCTDQFIVQRVLSAADEDNARRGTIFGGILKVLPLFIFVLPGVIAYALSQQGKLELAETDAALPTLIGVLLPVGLRGLVVAGLLAALMSSLSSVFNSCSTLITWDIYKKLKPDASEQSLVRVGQIATVILVGFGLAWIPMMKLISDQLYVYIQSVQGYISPPIAAVFLIGILWKRANAKGALASLLGGAVVGVIRMVLETNKATLDPSSLAFAFADVNFLHFALMLFIFCSAVLVIVSLMTPPPSDEQVAGMTFATADQSTAAAPELRPSDPAWKTKDKMLTVFLIAVVGIIWATFTDNESGHPMDSGEKNSAVEIERDADGNPISNPEVWPKLTAPVPLDEEMEAAITELMAKMSIEEKVGQTIQAEIRTVKPEDVKTYHLGSVLNGGGSHPNGDKNSSVQDWIDLADAFYEASMDTSDGGQPIPLIWGSDAVHGHNNVVGATLFPHNIGLGAMRNPDLIEKIGRATGVEMAVTGLDWTFAPTLAVVRDDRWGRTYEGYSEDPEIVADYAGRMVKGFQGAVGTEEFLDSAHVVSTAKHFLGDGGTVGGKDQGDNIDSEEDLRDHHGAGYTTALDAGVQTVMASFSSWHGMKMHGAKTLLTDVLKGQMGFNGFVVGDWNGHGQIPGCSNGNCPQSMIAGVDMYMVPEHWAELYENTLEQAKSGVIPMERLDDAVRRILRVKMRAGMFERGAPSTRPYSGKMEWIGAPEHREIARQAVRESLVLLKNNGGVLPLSPKGNYLIAGDGADNIGKQTGGWTITWQGTGNENSDFPGASSIGAALKSAIEAAGGSATISEDGSLANLGGVEPDAAIVVFGENPYAEFQGDRQSVEYQPGIKKDLPVLQKLKEAGIPVVSVFLSGRPMWVNPEINASDAFVAAWLPGTEGVGVADVLLRTADGEIGHDFKGKLSYTWPKKPSQSAINRGDEGIDPLFAYGFGLTYEDQVELPALDEEIDTRSGIDGRTNYFIGGPVAPWQLYVGDSQNWMVAEAGNPTTTINSEHLVLRAVDRRVQEDARSATWSGEAPALVFLHHTEPVDLSRESNGDLVLAMDVKVDKAPAGDAGLQMGCGGDCWSALNVGEIFREMEGEGWQTLRVLLGCFEEAGIDMKTIESPFGLATAGEMAVSFSDVRLVSLAEGETVCPETLEIAGTP